MGLVKTLILAAASPAVGGQAVIEGVLMRSPRAFAVAVRKPDGELAIKTEEWIPISERVKFLSWPFLRGAAMLFETLAEGMKALHYSAQQAGQEEGEEPMSNRALALTMALSLGLALMIFKFVPHFAAGYLTQWLGLSSDLKSPSFHVVDGIVKMFIFVTYLSLISRMPDIRRVFQYHGAEHKSIHVFEHGDPLDVAHARIYPRLHPRCGTTFLVFVILISTVVFAAVFPFLPSLAQFSKPLQLGISFLMKLPMLIPIAGISYEVLKFTGKLANNPRFGSILAPGMALQRLTTREPDDSQLEVALAALRAALDRDQIAYAPGVIPERLPAAVRAPL